MAAPTLLGTSSKGHTTIASSLTVSHTVAASTPLLIAIVSMFATATFGNSLVWNSTSLTLGSRLAGRGANGRSMEWWFLPNPTPATGNAVFTPNTNDYLTMGLFNVNAGLNVIGAIQNYFSVSATSFSLDITAIANALVLSYIVSDSNNQVFTQGGSDTLIFAENGLAVTDDRCAASSRVGANYTRTMSWTTSVSDAVNVMNLAIPSENGSSAPATPGNHFSASFG